MEGNNHIYSFKERNQNLFLYLFIQSQSQTGSQELTDEALDAQYVVDHVLTNTDRFLEGHVSGAFRVWHVIFIVSAALLTTSMSTDHMYLFNSSTKNRGLLKGFLEFFHAWLKMVSYQRLLNRPGRGRISS